MPVLNYSGEQINAKIVYYGPGLSGKTTNLDCIHKKMPAKAKGEMVSLKTRTDRTLFFDFLPLDFGDIGGYRTRFLLYTVPGQVYYNATRKLVLKGIDAAVFVVDSSPSAQQDNIESLHNFGENLKEYGLSLESIPWVIQYNKRDVENAVPVEQLQQSLNLLGVPAFEAVATQGTGVYETFEGIASLVHKELQAKLIQGGSGAAQSVSVQPVPPADDVADKVPATVSDVAADESGFEDAIDSVLREVDEPAEPMPGATTATEFPSLPADPPVQPVTPPVEQDSAVVTAGEHVFDISDDETDSYENLVAAVQCDDDIPSTSNDFGVQAAGSSPIPEAQPADSAPSVTREVAEPAPVAPQEAPVAPVDEVSPADSPPQAPIFPSISPEEIDDALGRTLELDAAAEAVTATVDAPSPEFITDPMGSHTPESEVIEELEIRVPLVISRAQVRKTMPIKLVLDIKILD